MTWLCPKSAETSAPTASRCVACADPRPSKRLPPRESVAVAPAAHPIAASPTPHDVDSFDYCSEARNSNKADYGVTQFGEWCKKKRTYRVNIHKCEVTPDAIGMRLTSARAIRVLMKPCWESALTLPGANR